MKNIKIGVGVVIVLALVVGLVLARDSGETLNESDSGVATTTANKTTSPTAKPSTTKNSGSPTIRSTLIETKEAESGLPEIEFIDKTLSFAMPGYDRVNVRVQKVAFGRGDAVNSTGCQGIPNTNFSAYLYPGSGICIPAKTVDGAPRAIVALHLLIENNGNYNFGGKASTMKLHYLRASVSGEPVHRFANALSSLASYNIVPYSSREIILSFLVPEDQTQFDLLFDYNGDILPDPAHNVYAESAGGLSISMSKKTFTLVTK